jgi:glucosamine--fructose-6-phosphate aminotransferase (isomerizing)
LYSKILFNLQEVKPRGGRALTVVTEGDDQLARMDGHVFMIPGTGDSVTPVLSGLPLQLFAYYVAVRRGCDVDRLRNVGRSVTAE